MDLHDNLRRTAVVLGAVVLSAGAYFLSSGLHRVWWLVWLAPLPVLLLSRRLRAWQAFTVALIARAVGGLNIWSYLSHVVQFPLWLLFLTILVPGACFALAVVLYRGLLRKGHPWLAMLAFPVTVVASEYLFSLSQGTFFNTGYTQLANLPILQLAALAGIWGISFSVNLFPAGVATLISAPAKRRLAAALAAFYVCVLFYGAMRLHSDREGMRSVRVGLAETHAGPNMFPNDAPTSLALLEKYAAQVQPLAAGGAQIIVFPEMSALIPDAASGTVDDLFEKAARDAHVQVLIGILHVSGHGAYNEGRLYSEEGEIETIYRKHHLVPTWENRSTPGTDISVLPHPEGRIGVQICRDMDYPELARRYGKEQAGLLLVPAWDQGVAVDAAFHGHLSLMRGVEAGFSQVRDAKNGLLTVADDRGRILAEKPTRSDGDLVTLLATVPVRHDATLYQRWGDWFAWIDLAALAALLAVWLSAQGARDEPVSPESSTVAEYATERRQRCEKR
jgi:apolipoprotein N-acyltransferase